MALLLNKKSMMPLAWAVIVGSGLLLVEAPQVHATTVTMLSLEPRASAVEIVRDYRRWRPPIYQKGRAPIYPYVYRGPGPRGWEFYGGFVPYKKGDFGTQALERSLYPDTIAWPPGMDVWPQQPEPHRRKRR